MKMRCEVVSRKAIMNCWLRWVSNSSKKPNQRHHVKIVHPSNELICHCQGYYLYFIQIIHFYHSSVMTTPARNFSKIRRSRPSYSCESCRARRVKCDQVCFFTILCNFLLTLHWFRFTQNVATVLEMRLIASTQWQLRSAKMDLEMKRKMNLQQRQQDENLVGKIPITSMAICHYKMVVVQDTLKIHSGLVWMLRWLLLLICFDRCYLSIDMSF